MKITDAVTGYWLERKRQLSPATYADYSLTFKRFAESFPTLDIEAVTPNHVRQFLNDLADDDDLDLSDKTLSNIWTALSSLFNWCEEELHTPHPMRDKVKRPQYTQKPIVPYSVTEVTAMLKAVDQGATWTTRTGKQTVSKRATALRDKAIILTLLDTGIRASELCNLSYNDYDAANGRLLIQHGKGDKARIVYVGDSTQKVLWRLLVGRKDGALFAVRSGAALNRTNLRKMIVRIAVRAGVRGASVHRFRHTFAVSFLRNGGNVFALQEILGHARIDTVKVYVKLAERDIAEAQRRASPVDNWRL